MAKGPTSKTDAKPERSGRLTPRAAGKLDAACRIAILHGKDAYLRAAYTTELREALAKAHGSVDTVVFDGANAQAADVLDECRSFGLIAGYKLVVVDNAEALIKEDVRPLFERYAQALIDAGGEAGATLLLRSDSWRPGRLDKLVEQIGTIVRCDPPREDDAVRWVARRAPKEHQCEIDPDAAALLVERVGAELVRLDSELGKLAAAAGGKGRIDRNLVAYFVGASREEQVWDIQRTLLTAGPEEGLRHLRYVLDVSRQPTVLVSYALIDLARKLHGASRATHQGVNAGALIKPLKLWGSTAEAVLKAARATPPRRALGLLRAAIESDVRQKSGRGEPERTLERLVLKFTEAAGSGETE